MSRTIAGTERGDDRLLDRNADRNDDLAQGHVGVQDVIESLVRGLPQHDRVLIMLHYTERLETNEIAAVLDREEARIADDLERIRTLVCARLERLGLAAG